MLLPGASYAVAHLGDHSEGDQGERWGCIGCRHQGLSREIRRLGAMVKTLFGECPQVPKPQWNDWGDVSLSSAPFVALFDSMQ